MPRTLATTQATTQATTVGTTQATTVGTTQATTVGTRPADDTCAVRIRDADKVAATRVRMLEPAEAERVAALFRLLGDPTRVRLLSALREAGELCVCDLAAAVGASETTVSHALRLLRQAGAVRVRRSGRMAYYALHDAHVRLLLESSTAHLAHEPVHQ